MTASTDFRPRCSRRTSRGRSTSPSASRPASAISTAPPCMTKHRCRSAGSRPAAMAASAARPELRSSPICAGSPSRPARNAIRSERMTEPSRPAIDVGESIDEGPWTTFQKLGVLLAALSIVLDGFDGQLIGYAIPVIIQEWGVSREDFAPIVASGLIGMGFGSALAGYVCDRFGRRPAIIGSVLLFGVATSCIGFSRISQPSRSFALSPGWVSEAPCRAAPRFRQSSLRCTGARLRSREPLSAFRWAACSRVSTRDMSCRSSAGACCSGWAARCPPRSASC